MRFADQCFSIIRYSCKKDALQLRQIFTTLSCILTSTYGRQDYPYAKKAYTCIEFIQQKRCLAFINL